MFLVKLIYRSCVGHESHGTESMIPTASNTQLGLRPENTDKIWSDE